MNFVTNLIIAFFGFAFATALTVTPIVIAWLQSPIWLLLLVLTFPFAVFFFVGAWDIIREEE